MKSKVRVLFVLLLTLSLSSCAFHNGSMNSSVSLSEANFSYVKKDLTGEAKTLKIFGIGGLSESAIVQNAKKDLLKNNPLESNQALANITVSWKTTFYLHLVITRKCTVTADIVEFK